MKKFLFLCIFVSLSSSSTTSYSQQSGGDFLPNDFKKISYSKLLQDAIFKKKSIPKKGEFETTQEYQQRLEKAQSRSSSTEAFPVFAAKRNIKFYYDPDTSEGRIQVETDNPLPIVPGIQLDYREISKGRYIGTNTFGARTVVTRYDSHAIQLGYDSDRYRLMSKAEYSKFRNFTNSNEPTLYFGSFDFKSTPEQAKEIKNFGNLVYIVRPVPPFHDVYERESNKATLANPTEGTHTTESIVVEIDEILLVNEKTRKVLSSIKTSDALERLKEPYRERISCISKLQIYQPADKCPKVFFGFDL